MKEFFFVIHSKATHICSETSNGFIKAKTATEALKKIRKKHSRGYIFSTGVFADANACHKGEAPIARWLSAGAKRVENKM